MTEIILKTSRDFYYFFRFLLLVSFWRVSLFLVILLLYLNPYTYQAVSVSLSDAYYGVSVFVTATLAVILAIEVFAKQDFGVFMQKLKRFQIPFAATLGATPGCGGAIVVTVQYVRGYASFGSLIAAFTATMGDAAFLLLAKEPQTALLLIAICFVAGIITGYVFDAININNRLSPKLNINRDVKENHNTYGCEQKNKNSKLMQSVITLSQSNCKRIYYIATMTFVPGFIIGSMLLLQWSPDSIAAYFYLPEGFINKFAVIMVFTKMTFWALRLFPDNQMLAMTKLADIQDNTKTGTPDRIIGDSCFITSLVVLAFVVYEVGRLFFGGIEVFFSEITWAMPLIAVLIGFIPGCGPQIVLCSLYISGVVPFSGLLANAISNDGDALFPALAIAPKASIYATLYTAIPALILGYLWYFLFE